MLGSPSNQSDENGLQLAKHYAARGRYELAEDCHRRWTKWYELNVVGKIDPIDTKEDRAQYRELLKGYYGYQAEFPLLIATRNNLIAFVSRHPEGVDRDEAKKHVVHEGTTSFGVICNQLDRGGWLTQDKQGKRSILKPATKSPPGDKAFPCHDVWHEDIVSSKNIDPRPGGLSVRYLLAIILPPVAVLLCGKPFQAMLNVVLTLLLWIPGALHALFVVSSHKADVRNQKLIKAMMAKR